MGSVPGASLFFCTYDTSKRVLGGGSSSSSPWVHMISAAMGETTACLVRVPTENVKQKMQVGMYDSLTDALRGVRAQRGFYVGYGTTVMREIPFAFIQFPLWEKLKATWADAQSVPTVRPWQSALCGSVSGGIAAALTTPIDVAKTRLMLNQIDHDASTTSPEAHRQRPPGLARAIAQVYAQDGMSGLFRGIGPRVMWISIGGSVFFGAYEQAYRTMR